MKASLCLNIKLNLLQYFPVTSHLDIIAIIYLAILNDLLFDSDILKILYKYQKVSKKFLL